MHTSYLLAGNTTVRFGERLLIGARTIEDRLYKTLSTPYSDTMTTGTATMTSGSALNTSGPHSSIAMSGLQATHILGSSSGGPLLAHLSMLFPGTGGSYQVLGGAIVSIVSCLLHGKALRSGKITPPSNKL